MRYKRPFPVGFPDRLRAVMELRGMSCRKLAKKCRCNHKTITAYVNGDCSPYVPIFARMCLALSVSPDWLLFGKGEPPNEKRDQG